MEKTMFKFDCRYQSERSERSASFMASVKPERVYFYGHKMPVNGECRGLKRNKIVFRAVWAWNEDFAGGSIESVKFDGASRKDKASSFVLGDVIELINTVVDMYIKEGL